MMSNKGIKRENSYIWNTDWAECAPTYLFFLLRDDQFTSVGFQSTIVLYTQEHSNTLCWGIKTKQNKKNTRENYHSAEIKAQSRSSSVFSSTSWKNLNTPSSRPNFKWTPYVTRTWAKVAIFFLYLKTYPHLANTFITRMSSPQLCPLVTQKNFFSRNFERFNNRWSFLIHESCIVLKSYSVEKNGSFRYLLPELSNCFHVYSSHFKKAVI